MFFAIIVLKYFCYVVLLSTDFFPYELLNLLVAPVPVFIRVYVWFSFCSEVAQNVVKKAILNLELCEFWF